MTGNPETIPSAAKPTSLWRDPDFIKLWTGQTISELGSRITRDGLPLVAVITLQATTAQMGLLTALGSLPGLVFGLFAGVWVDRLRRRPVMIAADIGRAVLLAAIPVAAWLHLLNLPLLYGVSLLVGTLTVIFEIAYPTYLPSLVDRIRLVEGNSRLALSHALAELLGPGLAGVLVQLLTAPIAILFDSASFVVSVVSLALIGKPEQVPEPAHDRPNVLGELKEGLRFVFSNRILTAVSLTAGMSSFFGSFFGVLYGLFVIRDLGLSPAILGLTVTMGGVGSLLGSVIARRLVRAFGLGWTITGSLAAAGLLNFLYPLAGGTLFRSLLCLLLAQLLGDAFFTTHEINELSLRQTITPSRLLGRTNASINLLASAISPAGALVGGLLAGAIGARATLVVASTGILLSSLWLVFSPIPGIREMPTYDTHP